MHPDYPERTPGPGAYDEQSAVGRQTLSKRPSSAIYGFGTMERGQGQKMFISAMHAAALRGVPTMRGAALARLAYSSLLLPSLWSLLRRLSPRDGGALGRLLAAAPDPGREPLTPLLLLLVEGAAHLLPVLDEREVFSERRPFGPDELAHLATPAIHAFSSL